MTVTKETALRDMVRLAAWGAECRPEQVAKHLEGTPEEFRTFVYAALGYAMSVANEALEERS